MSYNLRDEFFTLQFLSCTDACSNTLFENSRFDVDVPDLGRDWIPECPVGLKKSRYIIQMLTEKTGLLTKSRFAAWIKILVGEFIRSGWLVVLVVAAIVRKGFKIANWNSFQE